jgi:hypothetical protein
MFAVDSQSRPVVPDHGMHRAGIMDRAPVILEGSGQAQVEERLV